MARQLKQDLFKPLRVHFIGEEGIDAGGVKKEFFQLLITELLSPDYGMLIFQPVSLQTMATLHVWNYCERWPSGLLGCIAEPTLKSLLVSIAACWKQESCAMTTFILMASRLPVSSMMISASSHFMVFELGSSSGQGGLAVSVVL